MTYKPIDLNQVHTLALKERSSRVHTADCAHAPRAGASFAEFVDALPRIQFGLDIRQVVDALAEACRRKRPIIMAIGAHVIKCGLSPVLIALMNAGIVSCLAMNGAGAIHDAEIAIAGSTSEDVNAGLQGGTFGMVREVGELTVRALATNAKSGLGESLGNQLISECAEYIDSSLLATAVRNEIPVTVHVALGTDTIHMLAGVHASRIGEASLIDFRIFADVIRQLSGGVFINVGSAVILPEVFLKAIAIARNIGSELVDFTTVDIDMLPHYRPTMNVVTRPSSIGGRGFTLNGRHELLLPFLAFALLEKL